MHLQGTEALSSFHSPSPLFPLPPSVCSGHTPSPSSSCFFTVCALGVKDLRPQNSQLLGAFLRLSVSQRDLPEAPRPEISSLSYFLSDLLFFLILVISQHDSVYTFPYLFPALLFGAKSLGFTLEGVHKMETIPFLTLTVFAFLMLSLSCVWQKLCAT
jgi:hypothetical protein